MYNGLSENWYLSIYHKEIRNFVISVYNTMSPYTSTMLLCIKRLPVRNLLFLFSSLSTFAVYTLFSTSSNLGNIVHIRKMMRSKRFINLDQLHIKDRVSTSVISSPRPLITDRVGPVYSMPMNQTLNASLMFQSNATQDGKRQDECDHCFKNNFNYVIDNKDICKLVSKDQVVKVIIFITSVHSHFNRRIAIRNTWLSLYQNNTGEVRYAFLLGEINDTKLQIIVKKESIIYKDILKEDFVDSYKNLTYKTIMAFKWASINCAHAKYVMKTDDDMFVNVQNLIRRSEEYHNALKNGIGGVCRQKTRPIRNQNSKWFVSVNNYPNRFYPGYCSGTGYVTSLEVVKKVYDISSTVPFLYLEDVYVSLCIRKLKYKLKTLPGFNRNAPRQDPCHYKNGTLVTAHRLSPLQLANIWNSKCNNFKT